MPETMKLTECNLLRIRASPEYRDFLRNRKEKPLADRVLVCAPCDQGNQVFIFQMSAG